MFFRKKSSLVRHTITVTFDIEDEGYISWLIMPENKSKSTSYDQ